MASLKDMRVRIAATKATQKITKAMQMVAASKLRRAQAAAEAARPYAERMENVLRNIAGGMAGSDSAPKLLAGTGSDRVHLLIVATGERGLAGAFNSAIVRQTYSNFAPSIRNTQKRWAQVYDVRFLVTHQKPGWAEERYAEKLRRIAQR